MELDPLRLAHEYYQGPQEDITNLRSIVTYKESSRSFYKIYTKLLIWMRKSSTAKFNIMYSNL